MGIYADGEVMYQPDYNNIVAAIKGDGVVDGEEVTATDPSSMNIVVGSGSHYISQTKYNINEQQLTISESDPTYDRLDIVVAGTGGPSVVTGTPAEKPKPPAIPSNSILLAIVRVPAGATAITNSNIYDRRIFVTMDAIQDRVKKSGDTMSGSLTGITTLEADLLQINGTEIISSSRVLKNISGDGNLITNLNADLLDGYNKSDLDDEYVKKSGDTMTGNLNMQANIMPTSGATYNLGNETNCWNRAYFRQVRLYQPYNQIYFKYSNYDEVIWECNHSQDRAWQVYNFTDGICRAYLTLSSGNMYIDGSYNTFSPHVNEDEAEAVLKAELEKPYVERDEKRRIICPVCRKVYGHLSEDEEDYEERKRWVCNSPEHAKVVEEEYSHDIGLIALASGKLLLKLKAELEADIRDLKNRLAQIEQKLLQS